MMFSQNQFEDRNTGVLSPGIDVCVCLVCVDRLRSKLDYNEEPEVLWVGCCCFIKSVVNPCFEKEIYPIIFPSLGDQHWMH